MGIDEEARRMIEQEKGLEQARAILRENLPLVIALATHTENLPINNPALVSIAKACALVVGTPLLPPEEDPE